MKASEIIRKKLEDSSNESAIITLYNGEEFNVSMGRGDYFVSEKLPFQQVTFDIFDIVVDFLKSQPNFKARKGGCRNSKVGEDKCTKDTVMYSIATKYYGKSEGESSYDPLFVIAAILEWAGIAKNGHGFIKLIRK